MQEDAVKVQDDAAKVQDDTAGASQGGGGIYASPQKIKANEKLHNSDNSDNSDNFCTQSSQFAWETARISI